MGLSPHRHLGPVFRVASPEPLLMIRLRLVCVWLFFLCLDCLDVTCFLSGYPISFGFWVWSFAWIVLMSWLGASIDCFAFFVLCVVCAFANPCVRAYVLSVSIYHEPHGLAYPSIPHLAVSSSGARISSTPTPGHPISFFFPRCRSSETREGEKKLTNLVLPPPFVFHILLYFQMSRFRPGR